MAIKDPKGGLTAEGRRHFARKEGAHLKPGVKGPADTPEKLRRKGSFLRRHFANPRGPLVNESGEPTRLALSAHAWGESVPKSSAAARRLAAKGKRLLERYAKSKAKTKDKKASTTSRAATARATTTRAASANPRKATRKRTKKTSRKTSRKTSPRRATSPQ